MRLKIPFVLLTSYFILSTFVLGTIVGSFLAAAVYRVRAKKSGLILGRSMCPQCRHELSALDLVPLLSFLFLKGKCRYCRKKIGASYFWIELTTGLAFAGLVASFGIADLAQIAFYFFFTAILIFLAAYDWLTGEIPDSVSVPGIVLALGGILLPFTPSLTSSAFGLLVGGGGFLTLVLISNGKWMGGGDIRLGALLGVLLGFPGILIGIFLASLIGTMSALFLFVLQKIGVLNHKSKIINLKSSIPFAPALALGGYLTLLFGTEILNWYTTNFLGGIGI